MTKLPGSSKVIGLLIKNGFFYVSQKGSHQKYTNGERTVIVPAPRKEIPVGTLKSISKQSGIDYSHFINL
jgi:predicted RNA binding protein YcfA (HicA-like mRNA interferase family)